MRGSNASGIWPRLRNEMEDQETRVLYFPPLALYIYGYFILHNNLKGD